MTVTRSPAVADASAGASARAKGGGPLASERKWAWLFLAPTLIGLAVLSAGPILATLGISFTKWDLLTPARWVGLDNFQDLLANDRFWTALRNTVYYTIVSVPLGMVLALAIALGLDKAIRGIAWIRTMYLLPLVTSSLAVGLVWLWIYAPQGGLLNEVLRTLVRHPAPALGELGPVLGDARHHRDERLAGPRRQHHHLHRRSPGDPARVLRRSGRGRGGPLVALPAHDAAAAHAEHLLHRHPQPHRIAPGVRPGLRPVTTRATEANITLVFFIYEEGFRILPDGLRERCRVDPVRHRRRADGRLLPLPAPLGPLPMSARPEMTAAPIAWGPPPAPRRRDPGQVLRRLGLYTMLIVGGLDRDGAVPVDGLDRVQDPRRGLHQRSVRVPVGAPRRELRADVECPARRHVRRLLPQLAQDSDPLNTIGALVSCSLAAFAFAILPFRGKGLLFALVMATLIIPFQVVLVPNFVLFRALPHPFSDSGNWIGTHEPLWVGAWLGGAFGIFLVRQFFLTVPAELADAARVDGANPWRIFRHIYLPLARPVLATLAIFTFMWSWNDLISPLIYLSRLETYTTTVGLAFFQGQFVGKWPEMMAGAVVSIIPMVLLFVIAQQYFVRGIAISGLKG
ncbi:MAG: ABC transporter permease subunit [Chloroflexota bacterium]